MTNEENYVYIESSNPVQPVAPEKEETEMFSTAVFPRRTPWMESRIP